MKNLLILIGIALVLSSTACKPDAQKILEKSFEKCQSIENGYYEMIHSMKYMNDKDTSSGTYNCHFSKLTNDTIYSSAFHYHYSRGEYSGDVLYTGDAFVRYYKGDSSGVVMEKSRWANEIKRFSHNYTFYSPLSNRVSYPLPDPSDMPDDPHTFEFVGNEVLNDMQCYHVKFIQYPENDSADILQAMRYEISFWINKADYIPVQYAISIDLVEAKTDTMNQYEKNVLKSYQLNNLKDTTPLTMASIPTFINLQDYVPYKRPELLSDTIAPNFVLSSVDDEIVSLADFSGRLLLVDFFYKSCLPCVQALPALQKLHEKFNEQGLSVVGINPYDSKEEDDIVSFLAKRGITYTVLLGDDGKEVASQYHVSGYPTMYLIDQKGNIIYGQAGYGESTEAKLEELINEHL